jgi:uncharacterized protein with GYD domain
MYRPNCASGQRRHYGQIPRYSQLPGGGAKGVLDKGGTARETAIKTMVEGIGGRVESFYFAFGEDDVYLTVDVPDNTAAAAVSLRVNASGLARCRTVVLLTPEEIDAAAKQEVQYAAPGTTE